MFMACYYNMFYMFCSSYLIVVVNKRKRNAPEILACIIPKNVVTILCCKLFEDLLS